MIEKKTMGYVDFEYPQYEAVAATVIVDTETGKVETYNQGDDEWYKPDEKDRFYPTLEEANAALMKHKQELYSKMSDVKKYVETMNNWRREQKDEDNLKFEEEDYLPYSNRKTNCDDSYYRKQLGAAEKENEYLYSIIRTGFINIKGDSFKVDDVEHIKWGELKAELSLTGGRKVETSNDVEFCVIKNLFGKNHSGYTYTRLNEKTECNDK